MKGKKKTGEKKKMIFLWIDEATRVIEILWEICSGGDPSMCPIEY